MAINIKSTLYNGSNEAFLLMFTDLDLALFFVIIFIVLFAGYMAYFWRKPKDMDAAGEWSLGGRRFGTVVMWFLLGGVIYTQHIH